MLELLSNLMIGDAMDGLVNTGNSIIQWAQRGQWLVQPLLSVLEVIS